MKPLPSAAPGGGDPAARAPAVPLRSVASAGAGVPVAGAGAIGVGGPLGAAGSVLGVVPPAAPVPTAEPVPGVPVPFGVAVVPGAGVVGVVAAGRRRRLREGQRGDARGWPARRATRDDGRTCGCVAASSGAPEGTRESRG